MNDLLVLDKELWDNLGSMLLSPDEENRNLAFGMLENIDYTNKEQMKIFEDQMMLSMASIYMSGNEKGKMMHHYFILLEKQNDNN